MLKQIKKLACVPVLIIAVVSCYPKKILTEPETIITPLGDKLTVYDGSLVYALPMTIFRITAEFEKTIDKPGPYARFAEEMLGLKNVISTEKESWKIKSITLETSEEIDPSEYYVIGSKTIVQSNALALKRAGLILDLNPAKYDAEQRVISSSGMVDKNLSYTDLGSDEYFTSRSDTAYRMVKLDTMFIRIPYLIERKQQLTQEQLAERAAKTLLELREGKNMILTGEANVYPQSNAAIDEINRMEREYLALFAGKSASETRVMHYTFIPDNENIKKPVEIFRFSTSGGPSNISSKSGLPVVIELEPAGKIKDITYVPRPLSKEEGIASVISDKLYYRTPEVALIRIKYGNETLFETRRLVYQLGQTMQLPANYIIGK
ncbi:MAG TPA: DUF4831 family protein [Bacteroidales bacterium]|nr:DUF4831 family protein [Bacteroidales bacterium]HCI54564.1 hypothetical protein [Bacteroidales bacterium]HRC89620.1 DUF4831 family protein [Bacteroidales bacterium]